MKYLRIFQTIVSKLGRDSIRMIHGERKCKNKNRFLIKLSIVIGSSWELVNKNVLLKSKFLYLMC